jgi:hypothetical protein
VLAGTGGGGYCARFDTGNVHLVPRWPLPESRPSRRTRLRLQISPPDHFQAGARHQFGEIVLYDGSQEARSAGQAAGSRMAG